MVTDRCPRTNVSSATIASCDSLLMGKHDHKSTLAIMSAVSVASLFLLTFSVDAFHHVQPTSALSHKTQLSMNGDYLSSLSGSVPTTWNQSPPPPPGNFFSQLGTPKSGPLATENGFEVQQQPEDCPEIVTAFDESIYFAHAPKSFLDIEYLTPDGPRQNSDVGQPQDASRTLVEVDMRPSLTSNSISVGGWWCSAGGWPSPNPKSSTEVFLALSGRGCLTDDDGTRHYFGPGDTVVLPKHWTGRWDIFEDMHKLWFVHDHPDVDGTSSWVSIGKKHILRDFQDDNLADLDISPPTSTGLPTGAWAAVGVDPSENVVRAGVTTFQDLVSLHNLIPNAPYQTSEASPSTAAQTIYRVGSTAVGASLIDVGSYPIFRQVNTECFHVLEGAFLLTNDAGNTQRCVAGDTIVIPQGWTGQWDVVEACRCLKVVVG